MPPNEPKRIGLSVDVKPHAYDPAKEPELFEGVLARRVVAFLIDLIIISVPMILLAIFIFIFGLVTLGLGWFLFFLMSPIAVIWAIIYYGMTFGGAAFGHRRDACGRYRNAHLVPARRAISCSAPCTPSCFWLSVSFLTPFILLVALFNDRRRLLHDMLVGTVVINNEVRASALRRSRPP